MLNRIAILPAALALSGCVLPTAQTDLMESFIPVYSSELDDSFKVNPRNRVLITRYASALYKVYNRPNASVSEMDAVAKLCEAGRSIAASYPDLPQKPAYVMVEIAPSADPDEEDVLLYSFRGDCSASIGAGAFLRLPEG